MKSITLALLFLSYYTHGGYPKIPPTIGSPWPKPQSENLATGSMLMNVNNFSFVSTDNDCDTLQNAYKRYLNILKIHASISIDQTTNNKYISVLEPSENDYFTTMSVSVLQPCEKYPYLYMNEQYEIKICAPDNPNEITLVSQTVWGALRGLETFTHLGIQARKDFTLSFNCTQILDYPRFPHRGIMLDTSRHYLPVDKIMENMDLMAMNKFNVFHWHIVDDQSFPYESTVYPDLSKLGAWSDIHIYTEKDVASIIEYGRNLGIRVIAEFDTPGHTRSWGPGQPGLLTECYSDNKPDGTFGPIDPSNEDNYQFLETLFTEISSRFPDHYIHLGGDEVPFSCWKSNPDISDFMTTQNISGYASLEEYYIRRLLDIVSNLPNRNGYMVWQEVFDNGVEIANDTVVHVWKYEDMPHQYYPELQRVTEAGYEALLSSCWYLNYISYGVDWHKYYECDPQGFNGTFAQKKLVLGGEACMWGEYVDATNLTPRLWPRAAVVAERLWSAAENTADVDEAAPRLEEHRCRLLTRGYSVEPFGPSYCAGIL